jgi:hypothetical protein
MEPERLKRYQDINHLSDEALEESIQRRKEWKDVADRNSIGGEPMGTAPYIEFYTDPPIRFEFETKEKFDELRSSIEFLSAMPPDSATEEQWKTFFAQKTGWSTYDLS